MKPRLAAAAERSLFAGLFASIADEMLATLIRTAYSPNIKERRDCSTALFDGQGQLVAQAAAIPVHLGAMPLSVAAVLSAFDEWQPGDVVALNDPFRGGTHLPDVTMVSPVFTGDSEELFAFLASRAHHADMGGATPGSMPLSRDVYQEGLRIPPTKIVVAGSRRDDIWNILLANVRTPTERRGDLRAQVAAHTVGARRLGDVLTKHGRIQLATRMSDLIEYGESLMRAVVAAIPDGQYRFEDALDDDGFGTETIPIVVTATVAGDRAEIDFAGTAPACEGGVNAVEAITLSAVRYCFLCLMATRWEGAPVGTGEPPLNAGCFRPIEVVAPAGTVVNAGPPHGVAAGNVETSQRIVDVVLGALAQALPDVIPAASQGTMNNVTLGGRHPESGQPYAFYETIAGGTGAGPLGPGLDGAHAHMTNTWNTPVEALEFAYPFRVERYAIRDGSGGDGRRRGGNGLCREIRVLGRAQGTLISERRRSRPYGLAGGDPGQAGEDIVLRDGEIHPLGAKAVLDLAAGDVVRVSTPGGGGWGRP